MTFNISNLQSPSTMNGLNRTVLQIVMPGGDVLIGCYDYDSAWYNTAVAQKQGLVIDVRTFDSSPEAEIFVKQVVWGRSHFNGVEKEKSWTIVIYDYTICRFIAILRTKSSKYDVQIALEHTKEPDNSMFFAVPFEPDEALKWIKLRRGTYTTVGIKDLGREDLLEDRGVKQVVLPFSKEDVEDFLAIQREILDV